MTLLIIMLNNITDILEKYINQMAGHQSNYRPILVETRIACKMIFLLFCLLSTNEETLPRYEYYCEQVVAYT